MIRRYIIHLALISLLFISFSCGGNGGVGGSDDVPAESTITINPPEWVFDSISGDTVVNITAYVQNKEGIPLNDVEIVISGPLAAPRNPSRYQFYTDFNAAGNPVNSGFTAVTNENGVYQFSIKIYAVVNGSPSAFLDTLSISGQSAFSSIEISLGQ